MSKPESGYPREFSTRTVDPSWLLGRVQPVQRALLVYERWVEDHGWGQPVTARELLGRVFDVAFSLDGWLEILRVGEAKAQAKQTGLCSVLAILREACSRILQETDKVRWADDELKVVGFKAKTKPIRFGAATIAQLALAVGSLESWAADAPAENASPDPGAEQLEWSNAQSIAEWAKEFDCHRNTMRRLFDEGKVRNVKVNRNYKVCLNDLSPKQRAKHLPPPS